MIHSSPRIVCSLCFLFALFLASAGGCKKSSGTVSVHGRISYRGQPLTKSSVTFFPASGRPVTATAPQGEYTAELAPGDYTATVAVGIEYPAGYKEGDPVPQPKVVLPPEYTERARSKLKASVTKNENPSIDFELK
jgi:hypothetical protein